MSFLYLKELHCDKTSSEDRELSNTYSAPLKMRNNPLNEQNALSKVHYDPSRVQDAPSNVRNCSFIYLSRDYTENTNKDHTQGTREAALLMMGIWKTHIGQEILSLTKKREQLLSSALITYFENDLFHIPQN